MIVKRAITTTLLTATLLAVPLQVIIEPTAVNMASTLIVCFSAVATLLYIVCSKALDEQPLSTFAVFGFSVTTLLGALLVQTASWIPLSSSLYDPVGTFATLALYLGIALATHAAYRYFSAPKPYQQSTLRQMLDSVGIYTAPSSGALWCMGVLGLISMVGSRNINLVGKICAAFNFLAWAPFLIPLYLSEVGDGYCNARLNRILIGVFAFFIALAGVAFNTRGIMFTGVATVGLLYVLAGMRSDMKVTGRAMGRLGAGLVIAVIVSGPLADFATSMAIARQWRGKVSASVMIETTVRVYQQPALIAAYRAQSAAAARFNAYDEHYIDNPLLARFVNTKYNDNALHFAAGIKTEATQADLRAQTIKFLWAALPAPLLDVLGIDVDKDALGFSMGDYLAYLSRGIPLGAHRIGSIFAQGIAVFGPLFPFIYALICLGLYFLMDLLTIRHAEGRATLSTLGMLQIWTFFIGGLTYEALHVVFTFFIRNFLQILIIYVVVFAMIRLAGKMFTPQRSPMTNLQRAQ